MQNTDNLTEQPDFTIMTWKGHSIDLEKGPTIEQVDIEDIAHSLAMQCRFCGHPKRFYSIAEHSIYAALMANKMHAVYYLLHDGHEYIYHDISSPLKRLLFPPGMDTYKVKCNNTDETIMTALGLSIVGFRNLKKDIKEIDRMLLELEQRYLFSRGNVLPVFTDDHPLHGKPFGLDPEEAEQEFLRLFHQLTT
jgi:hypothetical protein